MIKLNHLTSCINGENKHNDQNAPFFTCVQNASKGQDSSLPFFNQVLISQSMRFKHKISISSSPIQQNHVHVMISYENMI